MVTALLHFLTTVKDSASRLAVVVNNNSFPCTLSLVKQHALLFIQTKMGTRGEVKMKWCSMIRGWT